MPKTNRNKKESEREIARERMAELFEQAQKSFPKRPDLADRYAQLARKISLKYKTPFKKEQKLSFCKNCSSFLVQGVNSRVRTNEGKLSIRCLKCNNIRRIKYR